MNSVCFSICCCCCCVVCACYSFFSVSDLRGLASSSREALLCDFRPRVDVLLAKDMLEMLRSHSFFCRSSDPMSVSFALMFCWLWGAPPLNRSFTPHFCFRFRFRFRDASKCRCKSLWASLLIEVKLEMFRSNNILADHQTQYQFRMH